MKSTDEYKKGLLMRSFFFCRLNHIFAEYSYRLHEEKDELHVREKQKMVAFWLFGLPRLFYFVSNSLGCIYRNCAK